LNGQSSLGFWDEEKSFSLYVESLEDEVKEEIYKRISDSDEAKKVWLTILALYVLEKTFSEQEDEWKLIAKKAQRWL
jgi:hypothetical protein